MRRDGAEKDDLVFRHMEERAALSKRLSEARQQQSREVQNLRNSIAAGDRAHNAPQLRAQFREAELVS